MAKTNDSRITPANYIAILGLALLALFTFFGWMYGSEEGETGVVVIATVFEIVVLAALLLAAIKAKSARSHFGLWRIVKWVSLALYVIVALIFANPLLKYFYVMSEKSSLQRMASTELDAIDSLYANYNSTMKSATDQAVQQITNYVYSGSRSYTMEAYIDSMDIVRSDVAAWGNNVRDKWHLDPDASLPELRNRIDSWGFFDVNIAQVGKEIEQKGYETARILESTVRHNIDVAHIVPIVRHDGTKYIIDSFVEPTFPTSEFGQFHQQLRDGNGTTIAGWIMFIVLHFCILLNLIVTQGTDIISPSRNANRNTKGIDL